VGSTPEEYDKNYEQGKKRAVLECIAEAMRTDRGDLLSAFRLEVAKSSLLRAN
jgi:hypothetical protein